MMKRYNVHKWEVIRKVFRQRLGWVLFLIVSLIISGSFRSLGASYIKNITEHVQSNGVNGIWGLIGITCLIQFINYFTRFTAAVSSTYLTQRVGLEIKLRIMEHLQHMPYRKFETYETGEIQSIIHNDGDKAAYYIYIVFSRIGTSLATSIFTFIAMAMIDVRVSLMIVVISVTIGTINYRILQNIKKNERSARKDLGKITNVVLNSCQTMDTIKAYRAQDYVSKCFGDYRQSYNKAKLNITKIDGYRLGLYTVVKNLTLFGAAIYLAYQSIQGKVTLGEVLAYITLLIQMLISVEMVFRWMFRVVGSNVAWERVSSVIDSAKAEDIQSDEPLSQFEMIENIEMNNISYNYDGENNIIQDINMTLTKGKIHGIVGESGSGKTTLLKCLIGLYTSQSQETLINGEKVNATTLKDSLAYVPSDNYLFAGTIYDNLVLGNTEITSDKCMALAKVLGLKEWIEALPKGIHTEVLEGGQNFSGGQRQSLCILRAMVSDRIMIVLDEPFSALDSDRSKKLHEMLNHIKDSRIIVFTSHRKDTFTACDHIYQVS